MGSSCGRAVEGAEVDRIPEGIAELKKQTQFTEQWKRKYNVTLNCYFTTVSRLCMKSMPIIKGCKGIVVVKIFITNNDPRHPKLSSILHTPVLQWHGIDIKLQLPKFLPLNLWEGEHTSYAFYHPETATNRGFCTVTGKIGQEQILLEEELRFGNPVPLDEWKSLSKDLEGHMEKYLKMTRKKIRTSADRTSQRDSHDTGYTSEQQPYPTLRYSELDTDSDQDSEIQRQRDQRSKARRKDTPHYGRPIIKASPKGFNIPLIEELEMNQDSSEDHTDQCGSKEGITDKITESRSGSGQDDTPRQTGKLSFVNKRKSSSRSICQKTSDDQGAVPKRKSRSLVDMSHLQDNVRELSPSVEVVSYHSAEKCVVRQRRKKKSLTSKLMKEKSMKEEESKLNQGQDDKASNDILPSFKSIDDAHDADDEDESKRKANKYSHEEDPKIITSEDGNENMLDEAIDKSNSERLHLNLTHDVSDHEMKAEQTSSEIVRANEDTHGEKSKDAILSEYHSGVQQILGTKKAVEIFKENSILAKVNNINDPAKSVDQCKEFSLIDINKTNAAIEEGGEVTRNPEKLNETRKESTEKQEQTGVDQISLEKQESIPDELKLKRVALTVDKIRKLQNVTTALHEGLGKSLTTDIECNNDERKPSIICEIDSKTVTRNVNEMEEESNASKSVSDKAESYERVLPNQDDSSSFQLSNKSPVRPKAESFSATEKRIPSPRKHFSLCTSEMKAQFMKKREGKSNVKPPLSGVKSFCEEN